jgi:hypothetical protein
MPESPYGIRAAEPADAAALRQTIAATMAHPEAGSRRASYKGAAERGELMLLERYTGRNRAARLEGFVEYHLKVDDTLTIRDVGSASDPPDATAVKYLLLELLRTLRPVTATLKVQEDAHAWIEILLSTPGFAQEGREYRRPHYIGIWRWSREAAERALRPAPAGRRRG